MVHKNHQSLSISLFSSTYIYFDDENKTADTSATNEQCLHNTIFFFMIIFNTFFGHSDSSYSMGRIQAHNAPKRQQTNNNKTTKQRTISAKKNIEQSAWRSHDSNGKIHKMRLAHTKRNNNFFLPYGTMMMITMIHFCRSSHILFFYLLFFHWFFARAY